jgi:hypothetical protein
MPESHKAEKRRIQKANRAAGIGDESGRQFRQKVAPSVSICTVCQKELTITKSNTELKNHAANKHSKALEECFPGADTIAAELLARAKPTGREGMEAIKKKSSKAIDGLEDLFSVGLRKGK